MAGFSTSTSPRVKGFFGKREGKCSQGILSIFLLLKHRLLVFLVVSGISRLRPAKSLIQQNVFVFFLFHPPSVLFFFVTPPPPAHSNLYRGRFKIRRLQITTVPYRTWAMEQKPEKQFQRKHRIKLDFFAFFVCGKRLDFKDGPSVFIRDLLLLLPPLLLFQRRLEKDPFIACWRRRPKWEGRGERRKGRGGGHLYGRKAVFPPFCDFVEGKNRMWRRRRGKARHDERKR